MSCRRPEKPSGVYKALSESKDQLRRRRHVPRPCWGRGICRRLDWPAGFHERGGLRLSFYLSHWSPRHPGPPGCLLCPRSAAEQRPPERRKNRAAGDGRPSLKARRESWPGTVSEASRRATARRRAPGPRYRHDLARATHGRGIVTDTTPELSGGRFSEESRR